MRKSKSHKHTKKSTNYIGIIILSTIVAFVTTFAPDNINGRIILILYLCLFLLFVAAGFIASRKNVDAKSGALAGTITALISFSTSLFILAIVNTKFRTNIGLHLSGLPVAAIIGALLGTIGAEVRIRKLLK